MCTKNMKNIELQPVNNVLTACIVSLRFGVIILYRSGYPNIVNLDGANHKDSVKQV